MMKIPFTAAITILTLNCFLVAGCTANNNFTPTDISVGSDVLLPGSLECSRIQDIGLGPTWSELTIGKSTLEEVEERFAPVQGTWDDVDGNYLFLNLDSKTSGRESWRVAEVCFKDNVLNGLNIYSFDVAGISLNDLLDEYGPPDAVTWGSDYYSRSLIWAEQGILVTVDVKTEVSGNMVLFPPIPRSELSNSWLMNALPKEGRVHQGDTEPLPPEKEVEDPWGIQK